MKHSLKWGLLGCLLALQACCPLDDFDELSHSDYEPVYLSRSDFENSVTLQKPRFIVNSGKIYIIENLLFINEVRKGFHIFDNTNAENPLPLNFINAPGSTDLAIRENVVFINQATDLVSARLSLGPSSVKVTKRIKGVFPDISSPDGHYPLDVPKDSIVIDWKLKSNRP